MTEPGEHCCPDCGAEIGPEPATCQALFDEVLSREYSDVRYARLHRLTVDAYALQHPSRYMRSARSFAAHLTGACAAFEFEEAAPINQAVQRWLSGHPDLIRPEEPPAGKRGAISIDHVHAAENPEQHLSRVREWAHSAWKAWAEHHQTARDWIRQAKA